MNRTLSLDVPALVGLFMCSWNAIRLDAQYWYSAELVSMGVFRKYHENRSVAL